MAVEFLSICIPTRNRADFLRQVLSAFEEQIRGGKIEETAVRIYLSDNASTDRTPEVAREFAARLPRLVYTPNAENIGGDRNFLRCVRLAQGPFCWLVGDDDIINPGALEYLLRTLKEQDPGLVINLDTGYTAKVMRPARFPSFRDFAAECVRTNLHLLMEHSLITCNVFRTAVFDQAFSDAMMYTFYAHMYGLVQGLNRHGGAVYLSEYPVLTVRERRAPAVDGVWPDIIEKAWMDYLSWMQQELKLPELRPDLVPALARDVLWRKITKNPFKYVWNNLPALVQPKAYGWFLRRVWFMNRRKH